LLLNASPSSGGGCPPLGDPRYCTECGPCAEGEGGCRGDDQCQAGLACAENFGALFGLPRAADVCLTPGGRPAPAFTATVLPAVETPTGPLPAIRLPASNPSTSMINDAGQLTGTASSGVPGQHRSVAFRFSTAGGMEALDPRGNQRSEGYLVNAAGDVFGAIFNGDRSRQIGLFIHRQDSGFDLLQEGSSPRIRQAFRVAAMNAAGDVVGNVVEFREPITDSQPFLYREGEGWQDLSALDPRLRQTQTFAGALNDAGDVLVLTNDFGFFRSFLVRGTEVVELGHFGGESTFANAINDTGRVVGESLTEDLFTNHAFVALRPGSPLIDIHPPQFAHSYASGVTEKGVVIGSIVTRNSADGPSADKLFTWDRRRTPKMKVQARRVDFLTLFDVPPRYELSAAISATNERLEVTGLVFAADEFGGDVRIEPYLYSLPYGLLDVEALTTAAGLDVPEPVVLGINDFGDLLVVYRSDEAAAVLRP
jgi:probable HAF family extracellular repeat protein